ncbi:MAG TPA: sulfatase-like hydrolase/transferase [Candidatus Sumerlaeota bacterium]|nr:sulfatase-like hydrolase/transferase [Candidatus Sumerlaeota bacterium]
MTQNCPETPTPSDSRTTPETPLWKLALWTVMTAGVTPLLVFVSTTTQLYSKNASFLQFDTGVLHPFWWAAFFAFLLGCVFFGVVAATRTIPYIGKILAGFGWAYLFLGPAFQLYGCLHFRSPLFDPPAPFWGLVALYAVLMALLAWKFHPRSLYFHASVALIVFGLMEIGIYRTTVKGAVPRVVTADLEKTVQAAPKKLPNIYHVIVDMYQSDVFDMVLDDKVKETLGGFHYFPKYVGAYSITDQAVSSILMGGPYDLNRPQREYFWKAFNGEESVATQLARAGYYNRLFLTLKTFPESKTAFQEIEWFPGYPSHTLSPQIQADNRRDFRTLWAYSQFPDFLGRYVGDSGVLEDMKKTRHFVFSKNVLETIRGFLEYIKIEKETPDHNVFTFMHLWNSHPPFLIHEDGSLTDGKEMTEMLPNQHGTLLMLNRFFDELKKNGRFKDALIIVHGDHGAGDGRYVPESEKLPILKTMGPDDDKETKHEREVYCNSRPLLLIKFPGEDGSTPLQVNPAPTQVFDLAATLMETAGLPQLPTQTGYSLYHPEKIPQDRKRHFYHFMPPWGQYPITPVMEEWKVQEGRYEKIGPVYLKNNPYKWNP